MTTETRGRAQFCDLSDMGTPCESHAATHRKRYLTAAAPHRFCHLHYRSRQAFAENPKILELHQFQIVKRAISLCIETSPDRPNMTPYSTVHSPFAVSIGGGRIGQVRIELGGVLAVLALAGVTFIPSLGTAGALLFLAAGSLLCALSPGRLINRALRDWPVVVLAVFCILSVTWSREPALSLRFGVQLAATMAIALAISQRLTPRAFCLAMAALLGGGMVASVFAGNVSGDSAAWTGIYGSKNAFAGAAATFSILAFGLALARGPGPLRVASTSAALAGLGLVVLAQSVGALILLTLTMTVTVLVLFAPLVGRTSALVALLIGGLLAIFLGLVASAHLPEMKTVFFETTGKDITLTGRTELWAVAFGLIAERPLLGVGYQAFWVKGHADAEALWQIFGIESRSGFNFHNMYLSNAVEIGLAGVALQSALLFATAWLAFRWTWATASPIAAVFFALTLMVVIGSTIEVPLYFQFSLRTVLIVAAFAYARDALGRSA